LDRAFAFHGFNWYSPKYFQDAKAEAESKVMLNKTHTIIGYDIDSRMIDIARKNAKLAGVEEYIQFAVRDFHTERDIGHRAKE
jgi:putative N6-adenine-specific DNA methylase